MARGSSRQLAANNMASLRDTALASALVRGSSTQDMVQHPTGARPSSQLTTGQVGAYNTNAAPSMQSQYRPALTRNSSKRPQTGMMKRPASGGLARVAVHGRSLQNLAYTSQKLTSALGNARPTAAHLALQAAYNLNSVSDAITALENYRSTGDAAAVT